MSWRPVFSLKELVGSASGRVTSCWGGVKAMWQFFLWGVKAHILLLSGTCCVEALASVVFSISWSLSQVAGAGSWGGGNQHLQRCNYCATCSLVEKYYAWIIGKNTKRLTARFPAASWYIFIELCCNYSRPNLSCSHPHVLLIGLYIWACVITCFCKVDLSSLF